MAKIRSDEEDALREQFGQFYADSHLAVNQRIEQAVCGCCYGGVSWATRTEIDRVNALLGLGPGDQLLDLGAGSGWPGLYLAEASGCDVTLTDLPHEGLVIAAERAKADGLTGAVHSIVADGAALPFKDQSFDALTHSDVLCCLPCKTEVLEECRRVIRGDGQMVFSVIFVTPDLEGGDRTRVIEAGPPYVDSEVSYEDMLAQTGWRVTDKIDQTAEYLDSIKTFFQTSGANKDDLIAASGQEEYEARMSREADLIHCLENRHLQRALYCAVPV